MKPSGLPAMPPDVAAAFEAIPSAARQPLLAARRLIFAVAEHEAVGPLTETLKWGEPAYLTAASRSGTTVRLGWKPAAPERWAVLVHCQTGLVDSFRERYSDELAFEGNRAIVFRVGNQIPEPALAGCLSLALTYHRAKRLRSA